MRAPGADRVIRFTVYRLRTSARRVRTLVGDAAVSKREPAGRVAGVELTLKPAQSLVAKSVEIEVGDQARHRERQLGRLQSRVDAIGDAYEGDVEVLEALEDERRVGEVSRHARHVLDENDVDPLLFDGLHQPLEPRALEASGADGLVLEDERGNHLGSRRSRRFHAPSYLVIG
ncbi:MAG: hypothetical protein KIT84_18620 [Labilithrix sp.]|nr:hypothetical protein [Labilithrix sp.]MCW5813048.1 hypothetical protein [Labilithrix sp.]